MTKVRTIYDLTDPEKYEKRYRYSAREAYLYLHWKPKISRLVQIFSKLKLVETALDVGCGTGVYTEEISKITNKVVGLDLSENMIKHGKEKRVNLLFIVGDARKLPFRSESFDLVVSIGLFEYVPRDIVLREITRVMRRNAFLIISVLNKYSAYRLPIKILSKFSKRYKEPLKEEHSLKEMLHLFNSHNLKLIWYEMDDGLVLIPDVLDRVIGMKVYRLIEMLFKKFFKRNPISNVMLFLLQKG